MPKETFPKRDREKERKIIDTIIADSSPIGMARGDSFRDDIKYGSGRKIDTQLELGLKKDPKIEQEIRVKVDKNSVTRLIYRIIQSEYLKINPFIEGGLRQENGLFNFSSGSEKESALLAEIFSDPVIQILAMENMDPDVDGSDPDLPFLVGMGLDLEKAGLLPSGITKKSYARSLLSEIQKLTKLSQSKRNNKALERLSTYTNKYTELVKDGFPPLTDKEAAPIIRILIARILKDKNLNQE